MNFYYWQNFPTIITSTPLLNKLHSYWIPNQPPSEAESVNQFKQQMQAGLEEAKAALDKAEQEYTQYYNRCCVPAPEFKPEDKVWLDASDIQTDQPSKKLADRNLGLFVVEHCVGFALGAAKCKTCGLC
uniref:Putative reverse transcriptase-rnase h-integrase n=1 Tax=Moniliophthora roreri TaxID=221103 RepID=A0A0W0F5H5_MONRR